MNKKLTCQVVKINIIIFVLIILVFQHSIGDEIKYINYKKVELQKDYYLSLQGTRGHDLFIYNSIPCCIIWKSNDNFYSNIYSLIDGTIIEENIKGIVFFSEEQNTFFSLESDDKKEWNLNVLDLKKTKGSNHTLQFKANIKTYYYERPSVLLANDAIIAVSYEHYESENLFAKFIKDLLSGGHGGETRVRERFCYIPNDPNTIKTNANLFVLRCKQRIDMVFKQDINIDASKIGFKKYETNIPFNVYKQECVYYKKEFGGKQFFFMNEKNIFLNDFDKIKFLSENPKYINIEFLKTDKNRLNTSLDLAYSFDSLIIVYSDKTLQSSDGSVIKITKSMNPESRVTGNILVPEFRRIEMVRVLKDEKLRLVVWGTDHNYQKYCILLEVTDFE